MKEKKIYWCEIEDLHNSEKSREKNEGEKEYLPVQEEAKLNRRQFMKLSAFTLGISAMLNACKQPVREAIPYILQPDDVFPGEANYYASAFYDGNNFAPILARVIDGRPVKIEGNDLCPFYMGGTTAKTQASLLSLYHPDRIKNPMEKGEPISFDIVNEKIGKKLDHLFENDLPLLIVSPTVISPSTRNVFGEFIKKYPNTEWFSYDEISYTSIVDAYGQCLNFDYLPLWHFDRAQTIVSINCDFLGTWLTPEIYTREYVSARNRIDNFTHIQLEATMSLTGTNADKRLPFKSDKEYIFLIQLFNSIAQSKGIPLRLDETEEDKKKSDEIADILLNSDSSLVVSGSHNIDNQIIVCGINYMLGNIGESIELLPNYLKSGKEYHLKERLDQIKSEGTGGVIFYNTDPITDFDPSLEEVIPYLDLSVSISTHNHKTSGLSEFVIPDYHPYESWRDYEPVKGRYYFSQPLVRPLFNGKQAEDFFLEWIGSAMDFRKLLKTRWEERIPAVEYPIAPGEDPWMKCIRNGVYFEEQEGIPVEIFNWKVLNRIQSISTFNGLVLEIYENVNYGTGMTTGNPWLLELPDPVSKISWQNYAAVSPLLAEKYGLSTGDEILINSEIKIPVAIQPGQETNTISVAWGYGKQFSGFSAVVPGPDLSHWIRTEGNYRSYRVNNVEIDKTGTKAEIPRIQTHDYMEERDPVMTVSRVNLNERPENTHKHEGFYEGYDYPGHKWGMVIDLDKCTGCNACVVACQAENNIPSVGSEEIQRHHDMYWLRIDRYYTGSEDNPKVVRQPVMCQHCESAPCENVCPVVATTHSKEGINQMIYNRCIGTRYCSNNCPYKVRTFNWFDYNMADALKGNTYDKTGMTEELPRMVINPDVVQRAKGVMEKCSFCIQRIEEVKIRVKKENRPLKDGEIKTACMQACPANAIIFGDLNDPDSEVSRLSGDKRAYKLLDELNTQPAVTYLKKITRC